jgi:hypothetical protein
MSNRDRHGAQPWGHAASRTSSRFRRPAQVSLPKVTRRFTSSIRGTLPTTIHSSCLHALTHLVDARILNFAFSPDGRRLAMARGAALSDLVLIKGLR